MAGTSLLALLDDIATILDDVAAMSKVAAKKTAGVLGDDLALNAQQVAGVRAERELPVVWAVARGSFVNKLILVPSALAISAFAPWAVTPLLMIGGLYLCYEGFEKIAHRWIHGAGEDAAHHAALTAALMDANADLAAIERGKIRGAIRTDFVLSAEIIVIALGTVADASFDRQILTLSIVAVVMTIGVYGLVAGIVKIDDAGAALVRRGAAGGIQQRIGTLLLGAAPRLMKILSIAGTAAMFMVGGGILTHGIPTLHGAIHYLAASIGQGPAGGIIEVLAASLMDAVAGIVAGAMAVAVVMLGWRVFARGTGK